MGGEGVAQAVRAELADAGFCGVAFHHLPHQLAADAAAFLPHEYEIARGVFEQFAARGFQVAFQPIHGFGAQRHDALLVALADYGNHAALQV